MRKPSARQRYIRLLLHWMDRMESILIRGLLIAAILMLTAQLLLRIPIVRETWSGTDRLEGDPVRSNETSP